MTALFRAWRDRRSIRKTCFHHDHITGQSWIDSRPVDQGRKLLWCTTCRKGWIL